MISIVCEAFGCTPREAELQSWPLVQAVLDYRAAKVPLDLMAQGDTGAKVLAEHPDMMKPVAEMRAAQAARAARITAQSMGVK